MVEKVVLVIGSITALVGVTIPLWVPMINHRLNKNKPPESEQAPVMQGLPVESYADDAIEAERRRADELAKDRDYWRERARLEGQALNAANRDLVRAGLEPHLID